MRLDLIKNRVTIMKKIIIVAVAALMLQGCAGLVIGTAAKATVAVAKVPFKVGGAVIGAVKSDKDD